jgi:hypothetical protein
MEPRLAMIPLLQLPMMKVAASVGEPEVRVAAWRDDLPVLAIEDASVAIELEFPDPEALDAFLQRVAGLRAGGEG